jgi:hypothetical protein
MNRKRINILFYLAKMPLLFLYVSFFIVQLFFNFDIANHSNDTTLLFSAKSVAAGHKFPGIVKTKNETRKKQTILLNKRFKPQVILSCNAIVIKSSSCYLETKTLVSHSGIFIAAPFLLSQSFRGPPLVT